MTKSLQNLISLPVILAENLDKPFCISPQKVITRRQLLAHALTISHMLPEKTYAINLCQNRYLFIVAYLAVFIRNQITLLPPNQSPRTIIDLLAGYANSYCISDEMNYTPALQGMTTYPQGMALDELDFFQMPDQINESDNVPFPFIDVNRTISISFTSGSTGKPKAIKKNWREFQSGAELALKQFGLTNQTATLVSTVPAQHMYGLETSLYWPLFSSLSIHDSRPFYPEDINAYLTTLDQPGILISSPTHLQACIKLNISWPDIKMLLSSTAPMTAALAHKAEATFNAPLYELFGSTETLSFASRRAAESQQWQTYQGIHLHEENHNFIVSGGHLAIPVKLDDLFLLHNAQSFSVVGRSNDLIKIAGKRASLTELNLILATIDGIDDGIFIPSHNERLSAIVVSHLSKKAILAALKPSLDAVFLPRMIYYVPALPRNRMGKINQTELQDLLQGLSIV